MSWSAPASDGGAPIENYTVTAAPGGATCSTPGEMLSCTVVGLTNGTGYTFTVTATNAVGTGAASTPTPTVTPVAPDTTAPPVPAGLVAVPGDGQVALSWSAVSAPDLVGYNVYRSTSAASLGVKLTPSPVVGTIFASTGLANGTAYFFRVTSVDFTGNESVPSDQASGMPSSDVPIEDHCGELETRETWASGAVHRLTCSVTVPEGSTLVIEPGAVVKAAEGTGMDIHGRLDVVGGGSSPTVFTSLSDDGWGGDTNGDGSASSPAERQWRGVVARSHSSVVALDQVLFSYAEQGLVGEPLSQMSIADSVFLESGSVTISVCESASVVRNVFEGTQLGLSACDATVEDLTMDRGLGIYSSSTSLKAVVISNPGEAALSVADARLSVEGASIHDAEIAIDAIGSSQVAFRGSIGDITGVRWVRTCNWAPNSDCGVDASYVDWGPGGPGTPGQPSRVCGQVLVDPWVGMTGANDAFRAPNCDGTVYRPNQHLADASSYANARLSAVYSTCDPNDPMFADACEVYARFQGCYGAAIVLAKAGSTFPIPDTPDDVAAGLASSLSDGLASSPDPFVTGDGILFQKVLGLLQVINISSALVNAYYQCAP